jgi:hypothetical protein
MSSANRVEFSSKGAADTASYQAAKKLPMTKRRPWSETQPRPGQPDKRIVVTKGQATAPFAFGTPLSVGS